MDVFRLSHAVVVLALALPMALPAAASKDSETPKKEMSLREKYALPSHIQLSPMMVPIKHPYLRTSAITVFLEPVEREHVGKICNNVPRIRDAILRVLSRTPVPTHRGKLVLDGIDVTFLSYINQVLDEEKIKGVLIEPGLVNLAGRQGGIARLPFATVNGCSGIKEIEKKLREAREKAKEH